MPQERDKWFTFMLALIIVMLGGIGAMQMYMNSQLWDKLDRVTKLMLSERDALKKQIDDEACRINGMAERVAGIEAVQKNGNGDKHK